MEGRKARMEQFLAQTEEYLKALESAPKSAHFLPAYKWFKNDFERLSYDVRMDADLAESMLTRANILSY